MDQTRLIVSRDSEEDLKIRGIDVLLDGRFIGAVTYGQVLELQIEPGHHDLTVSNRLKSFASEFDCEAGETVRFAAAGIALGGLWMIMTMLGTVAYKVRLERQE